MTMYLKHCKAGSFPLAILVLLLCAACGAERPARESVPAETAPLPAVESQLPGLADLAALEPRDSSGLHFLSGLNFLLKDDLAMTGAGGLELNGTSEAASWAIYQFDFPAICRATSAGYQLSGEAEEGAEVYFAISDYTSGRWRFAPVNESFPLLDDDYGTFTSPGGQTYLAVISYRGKATVSSVTIEDFPIPVIEGWLHSFDSRPGAGAFDQPIEFYMEADGNLLSIGRSTITSPDIEYFSLILRYTQEGNLLTAREVRLDVPAGDAPLVDRPYLAYGGNGDIYFAATVVDNFGEGDKGDILLMRMTSSFSIVWARRLVDGEKEVPNAIAVDGSGNLVCIGDSTWDGVLPRPDIEEFGFIFKLSADGDLLWNQKYTSSFRDERPLQLLCDPTDDTIHMRGLLDTGDGVFLASMNSAGAFISSRYWDQDRSDSVGGFLLEDDGNLLLSASESADGDTFGDPDVDGKIIMRIAPDGSVANATLLEVDNSAFFTTGAGAFRLDSEAGELSYVTTNKNISTLYKLASSDLSLLSNLQANIFGTFLFEADNGDLICAGTLSPSSPCANFVPLFSELTVSTLDITDQIVFGDTTVTLEDYTEATLITETKVVIQDSAGVENDLNEAGGGDTLLVRYILPE